MGSDYGILDDYKGLRVTDVCDGMDALGMQDIGLVDRAIHPLWRDIDNFKHRVYGLARTVRFVPTNRKRPEYTPEQFDEFKAEGYARAQGPFIEDIKKGDMIVIDGQDIGSVGFVGSNNAFSWIAAGAVGVVTNGGCRDTDELIKQRIPVYSRYINRTIRPARLELDTTNVKVNIGGALIRPGDVIVADGDGVVCVPIEVAADVAKWAWHVAKEDKRGRRNIYERLGIDPDWTVDVS